MSWEVCSCCGKRVPFCLGDQWLNPLCPPCKGHVTYRRCCTGWTWTGRCSCRGYLIPERCTP